ncbi:hypothetical protein AHAS_Ahas18G0244500 [Arachis hypogaea]
MLVLAPQAQAIVFSNALLKTQLSGSVGFETNNSSHMYMNRNESFQVIDWLLINIGAFVSAKWIDEFKLFNSVTLSLFSHVCSLTHFHFCAKEEKVIVLVIGGEGREHALCYALQRSPSCDAVFCAPGNAGISSSGNTTCLVNELVKAGIPTFGPSAEAAALEGSKNFMKHLYDKYDIPTAKRAPIVVKVDGLAAGKGVTLARTLEEAYEAVDSMLVKGDFGSAGPKRIGDGDTGPNTGGMGAYSLAPVLTKELQSIVMDHIITPTVKGMSAEGCKFVGLLYAGLMIEKKSGMPKLIEYNVRFGDPECQVLMVRLESDLAQVLLAACRGELSGESLNWLPGSAMVVVMASKGYPGKHEKVTLIKNLEGAEHAAPW